MDNNKAVRIPGWVIAILLTAVLGWMTTWALGVNSSLARQDSNITVLQTYRASDKEQLDRIEKKVDLLLLQEPSKPVR